MSAGVYGVSAWRKSTRSSGNGNCVEFAELGGGVAVRDSKDRGGPVLHFTETGWRAFLTALKAAEL
jgi:hypothetical protein